VQGGDAVTTLLLLAVLAQNKINIQNEGTNLGQYGYLNFVGDAIHCAPTNSGTIMRCTVDAGTPSSSSSGSYPALTDTEPSWLFYDSSCNTVASGSRWLGPHDPAVGSYPSMAGSGAYGVGIGTNPSGFSVCTHYWVPGAAQTNFLDWGRLSNFATQAGQMLQLRMAPSAGGITNMRIWVGMQENCGSSCGCFTTSTTPGGTNAIAFRYDTAAGDATWKGCTMAAGVQSCCNTSIAPVTNATQTLMWKKLTTTSVGFYVNGTLGCTQNTNVPNGVANGYMCAYTTNTSGAAIDFWLMRLGYTLGHME
jgi:hypothetical protein